MTKGVNVKHFLKHDWQENAVLSWTINEPSVSRTWEKLAPNPFRRLNSARKVQNKGYEVRLRIDPIVSTKDYQEKYRKLVDKIFRRELKPERITLGTLRGLPSTLVNTSDDSWKKYLDKTARTNWGYKPRFSQRLEMYLDLMDYLRSYGFQKVGICKETVKLWETLDWSFEKTTCNCLF